MNLIPRYMIAQFNRHLNTHPLRSDYYITPDGCLAVTFPSKYLPNKKRYENKEFKFCELADIIGYELTNKKIIVKLDSGDRTEIAYLTKNGFEY